VSARWDSRALEWKKAIGTPPRSEQAAAAQKSTANNPRTLNKPDSDIDFFFTCHALCPFEFVDPLLITHHRLLITWETGFMAAGAE